MRAILFFIFLLALSPPSAATEKIWDVAGQKAISEQNLLNKLIRSQSILIGIRMNNPAHHRRVAQIITDLVEAGRKPVILLGSIERDKQNAFAIFRHRHRGSSQIYDASGLDMLLEWASSSGFAWTMVRPVFDVAMIRNLSLKAVAFSRYEVGRLYHKGVEGLPDDVRNDLRPLLTPPVPKKIKSRLVEKIWMTYCADLVPAVTNKLIMVDRAQSGLFALMIAKIVQKSPRTIPVLISSQKYILADDGLPRFLKQLGVKGRAARVLFSESGPQHPSPKVDYIWYTDKISRPARCQSRPINHP